MDPEFLADLFAPFGTVTVRRMFGGQGIYHDGLMFALVADGELYMKVDEASKAAFEAAGSAPFTYSGKGKPVQMSYWRLPEAAMDDADDLKVWAERAYAAARRAKAGARKAGARKAGAGKRG